MPSASAPLYTKHLLEIRLFQVIMHHSQPMTFQDEILIEKACLS